MWAIVIVTLGLLNGPQALPVTEAGTYKSEAGCQAAITQSAPAKLDAEAKAAFADGTRRYVCVRVQEHGALPPR